MATADRELLSRTARNAVRGLMSDLVAGAIGEYWQNEHFAVDPDFTPGEGGVRKQLFDSYAVSVDDQVTRALRVFESMLRRLDRESRKFGGNGLPADTVADLREALARDGVRLDDELRLHTARVARLVVHAPVGDLEAWYSLSTRKGTAAVISVLKKDLHLTNPEPELTAFLTRLLTYFHVQPT